MSKKSKRRSPKNDDAKNIRSAAQAAAERKMPVVEKSRPAPNRRQDRGKH